jgi:hypothetical protein
VSLQRKPYVRPPRAPVKPIIGCRGIYAPSSELAVMVPKEVILRSPAYRRWVAAWPCNFCGWHETQCCHENLGKALQGKVCDSRTFSGCIPHGSHPGHHWMFDNYVDISREEARELGAKLSAQMRERAMAAGWRFTADAILPPAKVAA